MQLIEWQENHKYVISDFLSLMNHRTDSFILKGGTALMQCYSLDRFSEDIDLDALRHVKLIDFIESFCNSNQYSFRVAKDTPIVSRYMINYAPEINKPLKIEISYRNKNISTDYYLKINGIQVYSIDRLAQLKASAYQGRDRIRDLYDICFICNNYFHDLSDSTINYIRDALSYKGFDYFDYIVETQQDSLIDINKLADSYLKLFDKLGLLYSGEEKKLIINHCSSFNHSNTKNT